MTSVIASSAQPRHRTRLRALPGPSWVQRVFSNAPPLSPPAKATTLLELLALHKGWSVHKPDVGSVDVAGRHAVETPAESVPLTTIRRRTRVAEKGQEVLHALQQELYHESEKARAE